MIAEIKVVETLKNNPWLVPALFFGGGLLVGIFIDQVILPIIRKIASKTKWNFDDIIVNSLKGLFIIWFGILGARLALESAPDSLSTRTVDLASNTLKILFIASLTLLAARIVSSLLQRYIRKTGTQIPGASIFTNIIKLVIFVIGLLMILGAIGIQITPILTALGVGGLAVALALQDTLSNLFAGIHIVASKQITPGDYVKLDSGNEGYVVDIGWRNTTIKAPANNMIIVPNSKMASAIVINYYQPDCEMGVGVEISVSGDSDLEKVESVTIETAKGIIEKTSGAVNTGAPAVRFTSFSDGSINFAIGFRVREVADQHLIKHEFLKALHKRYKQEGIALARPTRTVYVKEGAKLA